jgi:hypothetical protein
MFNKEPWMRVAGDYPLVSTFHEADQWAESCNKSGGIIPERAMAIVCSSMRAQNQRRASR